MGEDLTSQVLLCHLVPHEDGDSPLLTLLGDRHWVLWDNIRLLQDVGYHLKASGKAFVCAGDWNITPRQLQDTGWLGQLGAKVLGSDASATCLGKRAGKAVGLHCYHRRARVSLGI